MDKECEKSILFSYRVFNVWNSTSNTQVSIDSNICEWYGVRETLNRTDEEEGEHSKMKSVCVRVCGKREKELCRWVSESYRFNFVHSFVFDSHLVATYVERCTYLYTALWQVVSLLGIRGQRCIDTCRSVRRNMQQILPTHFISAWTDILFLVSSTACMSNISETEIDSMNRIFQRKVISAPLAPAIRKILNLRTPYIQAFNTSEQYSL